MSDGWRPTDTGQRTMEQCLLSVESKKIKSKCARIIFQTWSQSKDSFRKIKAKRQQQPQVFQAEKGEPGGNSGP